jgi:hypothetical protein
MGRGPRSGEQEDELLEAAIAAPRLGRCAVVGVVAATAGAGRATVAALLAVALAATRRGLTVAVDARPGPGRSPTGWPRTSTCPPATFSGCSTSRR